MKHELIFFLLLVCVIFISSMSQVLLKTAALKTYQKKWMEYLNFRVIFAYSVYFFVVVAVLFILRVLPLSVVQLSDSLGYIFIAVLSRFFLKERLSNRKIFAIILIIIGITIYIL